MSHALVSRGLSKVLAEETAWKMSREPECPFQLTVLLPTLIWGPMVPGQPHLNTSANSLVGYMDGSIQEKPSTGSGHQGNSPVRPEHLGLGNRFYRTYQREVNS